MSTGYAKLLGALCNNSTEVVYVSPALQHMLHVTAMTPGAERSKELVTLEKLVEHLRNRPPAACEATVKDEEISWESKNGTVRCSSALLPPCKAYAVYPTMASCLESKPFEA